MVERADIVLENYRPGVMDRLGLGYEALSAVNPRIIVGSVSGYGHNNVWSHRGAFAAAVQAETGLTADIARRRDADPRNDPLSQSDVYGGLQALAAILAAVHHRHRTGEGQAVEVDMAEATLVANDMTAINLRDDSEVTEGFRSGSNWPPCYQLSHGGWVTVTADPAVGGAFGLWTKAMARPELIEDVRFATMADRMANADALHAIIGEWVSQFDSAAALEAAIGFSSVLVADVRTAQGIQETEWAADRGAFVEVPLKPGSDPVTVPQAAWRFNKSASGVVPTVGFRGEHNRQVLAEVFGIGAEELDALEADDVISDRIPAWRSQND